MAKHSNTWHVYVNNLYLINYIWTQYFWFNSSMNFLVLSYKTAGGLAVASYLWSGINSKIYFSVQKKGTWLQPDWIMENISHYEKNEKIKIYI